MEEPHWLVQSGAELWRATECYATVHDGHLLQLSRWRFQIFLSSPYLGNISDMTKVFRMGWNHQLDLYYFVLVAWNLCRCFFWIFQSGFMLHQPHVKSSPTPWPVITPIVLRWFVHSSVQMLKFWWLAVVDQRCLSKCTWKAAIDVHRSYTPDVWCGTWKNEHLTKGGFRL